MRINNKLLSSIAILALLGACKSSDNKEASKGDILVTNMDTTVNPADDFFDYANGAWVKKNPIPAEETGWGIAHLVQEELYQRLKKINVDAEAKKAKSGTDQQIGDFWFSGMDSAGIEQTGIKPLQPELDKIAAMKTPQDVMIQASHMHTYGVGVFFDEGPSQDEKNSEIMAYHMSQGGLGLPNRDYYFNTDARTAKIRNEYLKFIAKIFVLTGTDSTTAAAKATAIIAMETKK
jgi:putative endopeptidase